MAILDFDSAAIERDSKARRLFRLGLSERTLVP